MKDILFSKDGFGLKPTLFTKSTQKLSPSQRQPQTGKDHLTYFVSDPRPHVARFCSERIALSAAEKMLSTYVGNEEEGSGFHKYIAANGNIYPSYMLHRTVTGRTASAHPNGQNFPKRSPKNGPDWAGMYQGIFLARPGWKLVNCDLSQIELRLVAWMAREQVMLGIYRDGGDIHTTTAMRVLGYSQEQWDALTLKERKDLRFKAKAVTAILSAFADACSHVVLTCKIAGRALKCIDEVLFARFRRVTCRIMDNSLLAIFILVQLT
jgi:hypothetical protein